jgi:Arc/MetJ-type ribon-helix-helix transcriptional regulator
MMTPPTKGAVVAKSNVAVALGVKTLERVDRLVRSARFPNRSQAIESALNAQLDRMERTRLAEECAKLDSAEERSLAEEGIAADAGGWPEH